MTVNDHVARHLEMYPTLYKATEYAHSRAIVLEDAFLGIGNGLYWHKGYRVDTTRKSKSYDYGIKWVANRDEKKQMKASAASYASRPHQDPVYSPYPISELTPLNSVPDDIQEDWLDAALEVIDRAIAYYNNKREYVKNSYYPTPTAMKEYEDKKNGIPAFDYNKLWNSPDLKDILRKAFAAKPSEFVPQPETVTELTADFDRYRKSQKAYLYKAKKRCLAIKASRVS